jgi:hypothetical protein
MVSGTLGLKSSGAYGEIWISLLITRSRNTQHLTRPITSFSCILKIRRHEILTLIWLFWQRDITISGRGQKTEEHL